MTLHHVSLFSGVGGFDVAAERLGLTPAAMCELDNAAAGVLAHHWPGVPLFRDVKEVTGDSLRQLGIDPDRTVITGGFPCQDLSIAGAQAGLEGERSGLFYEILRIVREFQPRWFVLENVPGLLSSQRGRDMGIVLSTLVDSGYGVAYRVLDAQFFGVPQRRRRVFVVGHRGDEWTAPAEVLALGEGGDGNPDPRPATRQGSARAAGAGTPAGEWFGIGVNVGNPDIAGTLVSNNAGGLRTTDIAAAYVVQVADE